MQNRKSQFGSFAVYFVTMFAVMSLYTSPGAQSAYFWTSTNAKPWVDSGARAGTTWATTTNYFDVDPATTYQTIQGFGGCFSEMAWDAVQSLPSAAARDSVIRALFDTSGCNYTFCRMPIGSNDFADSYYSLNDVSGDYQMTNFSLKRDSTKLIPFIKAAQVYKPNLRFWASPWTPPSWMKKNNNYYTNTTAAENHIKADATTLGAYALYLSKAIQEFKKAGINIEFITCQNEPDQDNHNYPTCGWTYAEEQTFYKTYMIPRFQQDNLTTKILLGVYCCTSYADGITSFMNDATIKSWVGVTSHSWQDYNFGAQATKDYPTIPFFQTEADWGSNGAHDWNQGVTQFNSMINFLTTGKASVFTQWGMILDQRYSTNWDFKQSGPININSTTHVITYEPHYWAIKHIEHFVMVGAKAIKATLGGGNPGQFAAFLNPNGDIILCASNVTSAAYASTIKVGNRMYKATFPANSFNTIRIANATGVQGTIKKISNATLSLNGARIRNSTLCFSLSAGADALEADITLKNLQGRTIWTRHCAGGTLQGRQAFVIQPEHGNLCSGSYLLVARIKDGAGAVSTVEKKVAAVD